MRALNEEITEEFLESLVDRSVNRIESALEAIDVSVDYVAALLSGGNALDMNIRQKNMGRHGRAVAASTPDAAVPDTE